MTEQVGPGLGLAPFDWAIIAILTVSTLMSLRRGFLKGGSKPRFLDCRFCHRTSVPWTHGPVA